MMYPVPVRMEKVGKGWKCIPIRADMPEAQRIATTGFGAEAVTAIRDTQMQCERKLKQSVLLILTQGR